jgi:hypothetical protein
VIHVGKHSAERRSALPWILATVAVLGIAAAAVLLVRVFGSSPSTPISAPAPVTTTSPTSSSAPSSSGAPTSTTTATASAADSAARAALKACVDRQAGATGLLDSITTGAGHWSDHVQAETDLEAGRRALIDVTTNTWGPTRAAGPGDVTRFQAASAGFDQLPGCSTDVAGAAASTSVAAQLKACATREAALDTVVTVGTRVMGDWQTHLSEMADHADGHINNAQAQANWRKRWSASGTNLDPYKTAVASLAAAPACTA